MAQQMWIGTRGFERWFRAPNPDFEMPKFSWSANVEYMNGGQKVRHSKAGARTYNWFWLGTRDDLRFITDLYDGVYDTQDGVNLIYFIDLAAADTNVAPQALAFPAQPDAVPLVVGKKPSRVPTDVNTLGYPARTAVYLLEPGDVFRSVYFPIPPGHSAWIGAHGTATDTAAVQVTPCTAGGPDSPIEVTLLGVTTTTRVNMELSSADWTGFEVSLAGEGELRLTGVIIQILPTGVSPKSGGYISGRGHSGCQFSAAPMETMYHLAGGSDRIGVSASLVETGLWI